MSFLDKQEEQSSVASLDSVYIGLPLNKRIKTEEIKTPNTTK